MMWSIPVTFCSCQVLAAFIVEQNITLQIKQTAALQHRLQLNTIRVGTDAACVRRITRSASCRQSPKACFNFQAVITSKRALRRQALSVQRMPTKSSDLCQRTAMQTGGRWYLELSQSKYTASGRSSFSYSVPRFWASSGPTKRKKYTTFYTRTKTTTTITKKFHSGEVLNSETRGEGPKRSPTQS